MIPTIGHCGKHKTMEIAKLQMSGCQDLGEGGMNRQSIEDFLGP